MRCRGSGMICFAVLLASSIPTAVAEGPGWIYNASVVNIVDVSNGGINVRITPDLTGCTSQSGYGAHFASVAPSHPALSRIKATLLTAFVTGTPVSLYLGDSTCTVAEVILGAN